MRRTALFSVAVLLLFGLRAATAMEPAPAATLAVAQEEKKAEDKDQKEEPEKEESEDVADDASEAKAKKVPALAAIKTLTGEFNERMATFMEKVNSPKFMREYRKASRAGREEAMKFRRDAGEPDREEYEAEITEVAAYSMAWIAANGRGKQRKAAMDYLFANHADSPAMEMLVERAGLGVSPRVAEERLRALIEQNESKKIKGIAMIDLAETLADREPKDTTEIEELYQTVIDKYSDCLLYTSPSPRD